MAEVKTIAALLRRAARAAQQGDHKAARAAFEAAFAPFGAAAEALARLGDAAAPEDVAEARRRRRRNSNVAAAATAMRL